MPLTDGSLNVIAPAIIGGTYTAYNGANAYIGVGDNSGAFDASQTDLLASSNKTYKPMDGGYPTSSFNAMTFESTFGTGDANYAWNEWAVFNAYPSGVMLNRKVESLGTKSNTQIWVLQVTLSLGTP